MLVKEDSGVNIENYWESDAYNDPNGNKSLLPLQSIIPDGNFRCASIEDLEFPDEVCFSVFIFHQSVYTKTSVL